MKLGVVGLPNVGKSTLFNAITNAGAMSANYPFCTIEPNVGIVAVPDERLEKLAKLYDCKKITPTAIEFVDIAGLVKGASKGEGLGNKFLSHIREVDAIVHVVRCFSNENITHVEGDIDPIRDMEIINMELALADLESLEKRYAKAFNMKKTGDKKYEMECEILKKLIDALNNGVYPRSMTFSPEAQEYIKSLFLITAKPVIYVANIAEDQIGTDVKEANLVIEQAKKESAEAVVISAKIEEDLASLSEEEKSIFVEELNLTETGLSKLIKACYRLLGLISFLTAGEKETRAWTIKNGTKAPQAAGAIHTDFERGFIKAEVIDCETILDLGGYTQAKEKGKVRVEGKDYVVKDGDVMLFRFNV